MVIYDLNILNRDLNQDELYNLFRLTFQKYRGGQMSVMTAEPEDEMRIDSVCYKIYESVDYCDLLMNINDIDNPLNIMSGDLFAFPPLGLVDEYRLRDADNENTRSILLNARKSTRKDPNRTKFVEESQLLPPNMLQVPTAPMRIENNQLIIGG